MIKTPNLVLASKSAIRQKLLKNAEIEFEAIGANIDEEYAKIAMRENGFSPSQQAHELAKLKAQKISSGNEKIVIGCDQILSFNGIAYDKAETMEIARQRLLQLQGKTHFLEGAVVIMRAGQLIWRHDSKAELTMHNLSEANIDEYLKRAGEQILAAVGCYELEGLGAQLFSKIKGDYFAILGLPLIEIIGFLRQYEL